MEHYLVRPVSGSVLDWSEATPLAGFTFAWEQRTAPRTEFRALWNESHLHFRFDCVDDDLVLPDAPTVKERVLGSDRTEIFFAPELNLKPYYANYYREMNWDWRCDGLQLAAHIEGNRYTVAGSLPLDTLRALHVLKPGSSELFAGIYRADFRHHSDGTIHSGWMPWVNPETERPDFHVPASFGVLKLMQ